MTDFRELCAELLEIVEGEYEGTGCNTELRESARAALAQPEPKIPTDEELMAVFEEYENGLEEIWACDWPAAARAVLARWGKA